MSSGFLDTVDGGLNLQAHLAAEYLLPVISSRLVPSISKEQTPLHPHDRPHRTRHARDVCACVVCVTLLAVESVSVCGVVSGKSEVQVWCARGVVIAVGQRTRQRTGARGDCSRLVLVVRTVVSQFVTAYTVQM